MAPATTTQTNPVSSSQAKLSLRDRQILAGLAVFKVPKVQAEELGLSVAAIYKAHRRIEKRLGLSSRVELYTFAKQVGSAEPGVSTIGTGPALRPRAEHPTPCICVNGAHAGAVALTHLR